MSVGPMFFNGQMLFANGVPAFGPECCCATNKCCKDGPPLGMYAQFPGASIPVWFPNPGGIAAQQCGDVNSILNGQAYTMNLAPGTILPTPTSCQIVNNFGEEGSPENVYTACTDSKLAVLCGGGRVEALWFYMARVCTTSKTHLGNSCWTTYQDEAKLGIDCDVVVQIILCHDTVMLGFCYWAAQIAIVKSGSSGICLYWTFRTARVDPVGPYDPSSMPFPYGTDCTLPSFELVYDATHSGPDSADKDDCDPMYIGYVSTVGDPCSLPLVSVGSV